MKNKKILCPSIYNDTFFNIFQIRRLPVVPFHESSSGSPLLSLHQSIDKSSGEAQCSVGAVLQHLALNLHIARTDGPVSILTAVPQAVRQIGSICRVGCLLNFTHCLEDQTNPPDFEKVLLEGQSFHFSEKYKEAIKTLLPLFEQKGWLDFETV